MKRLPLLAALPLLCASVASASSLMSVGYFNGGGDVTAGPGGDINKLDVRQITHLNYSFGLVYNDEKDETNAALKDPAKLHQIWLSPKVASDLALIPTLRKQNPNLKVLLSVGGWGARGFSGAAATQESRAVFIRSAQEIVEKYGLDGIDLDWEYPVNGAWGLVASQPADRDNFTALLKEMRDAFGHKKLVTIAVGANAESPKSWVDVKAIAPLLDYINLMTYDMAYGTQYFNANLYDSSAWPTVAAADKYSVDFVVNNYLAAGLKPLAELLMLEQQYASGLPADDQRAGGQVTDEILPVVQRRRVERGDITDERLHRGALVRIPGRIGRQHGLYFRFRIHGSRFSALSVQRPPLRLTTNRSRTDI